MNREKRGVKGTVMILVMVFFASAFLTRCASVGTPEGGPNDTLPPVIINILPDNYTTNMDTLLTRVYIEFDELVQLKDQQSEFFTSPKMTNTPQLQIRGRGVVVTLKDTLKPNTTYALNFGSAIQDYNESNPLSSMRYVFSTGASVDSMIMSGYTEDSYKADSVSGTFIFLYPRDSVDITPEYDSTLFNSTPAVIARSEKNGIFLAQNLKPIPYHVYALYDTNGNLTYEPGVDKVGFLDGTYNPAELDDFAVWLDTARRYVVAEPQLHFRMFLDKAFQRQVLMESSRPIQRKAILDFGAEYPIIDSIIFDSIPEGRFIVENLKSERDSLAIWFDMPAESLPDTIRGRIVYFKHDSLNELTRTSEDLRLSWRLFESKEVQQEREKQERAKQKAEERGEEWVEPEVPNPFKVTYSSTAQVNPELDITFDFEYPLSRIDTAAITFTSLTAKELEIIEQQKSEASDSAATTTQYRGKEYPFTFERDTMNLRRWYLRTKFGEVGDEYYLTIPQGAVTDIAGMSNDTISVKYTPLDKEKYATVIVELLADAERPSKYILELLKESGPTVLERKVSVDPGMVTFNYVPAGNVTLRVLQDLNDNGEWDSGDLVRSIQPEKSQIFTQGGESLVATKVNWEITLQVDPAVLFADETQEELSKRLDEQERQRLRRAAEQRLTQSESKRKR